MKRSLRGALLALLAVSVSAAPARDQDKESKMYNRSGFRIAAYLSAVLTTYADGPLADVIRPLLQEVQNHG